MPHRILICDDEPHIALAASMKFKNAGFEVHTARNGEEAWESILRDPPDVLITDCTMPRMDGLELCRRIRSLSPASNLPILLLTARGMELDVPVVKDLLGISKVVLKPFSPRELLRDVQETLRIAPAGAV